MRRFLKNYSVQTTSKLINENPDGSSPILETVDPMLGPDIAAAYSEVAKDFITHAALVIGVTFSVCCIVKRLCK